MMAEWMPTESSDVCLTGDGCRSGDAGRPVGLDPQTVQTVLDVAVVVSYALDSRG